MKINKKLPDTEFDTMSAVWNMPQPVTSSMAVDYLNTNGKKELKPQTVLTMLVRLEKKGFLRSEKNGKEREYYAVVSEEEYMQFETVSFLSKFKKGPMSGLINAIYNDREISKEDVEELRSWLEEKK